MRMGKALSEQELHNLAMNIVGRELETSGYEFMAVNSTIGKNPQFVCLKDSMLHFIVVRCVDYPNDPRSFDVALMNPVIAHARIHEARVFYAGVGLYNAQNQSEPVVLNEPYIVDYEGLNEM